MKRIILCFLFLVVISCSGIASAEYDNEITFQGIPWLANEQEVFNALAQAGLIISTYKTIDFDRVDSMYLKMDNGSDVVPVTDGKNDYLLTASLRDVAKGKMAGYPISSLSLSFAYDGEFQLIYVKVDLLGANYTSIKEKLTRVYGNCEEIKTIEGHTFLWKGLNNSGVVLFEYYDGKAFDLCYGRLDAAEILQNCMAPADPDDVSGL